MVPVFEALYRSERVWKNLTRQQQALFRTVITEAFAPGPGGPGPAVPDGIPAEPCL